MWQGLLRRPAAEALSGDSVSVSDSPQLPGRLTCFIKALSGRSRGSSRPSPDVGPTPAAYVPAEDRSGIKQLFMRNRCSLELPKTVRKADSGAPRIRASVDVANPLGSIKERPTSSLSSFTSSSGQETPGMKRTLAMLTSSGEEETSSSAPCSGEDADVVGVDGACPREDGSAPQQQQLHNDNRAGTSPRPETVPQCAPAISEPTPTLAHGSPSPQQLLPVVAGPTTDAAPKPQPAAARPVGQLSRALAAAAAGASFPIAASAPACQLPSAATLASLAVLTPQQRPASASASVAALVGPSPAPAPAPAAAHFCRLLAMCPGAPDAMRRPVWTLKDYDVTRRIAKAPTSSVYKAVCRRSGLAVALKIYFLDRVPRNVVHMLKREITIQTSMVHKHVVMLYGAFQDDQHLVLVEEMAANGDLQHLLGSLGSRMSELQARALVLGPLLEAVAHLHAGGVCHRDIKPDNLLFTQDWRLVLGDFGIAINMMLERAVTRAGTVGFMAPEVERCPVKHRPEDNKHDASLAYTTAVDVWAIGSLAYALLTGFPPTRSPARGPAHHPFAGADAEAEAEEALAYLSFPASTTAPARDFILAALAHRPEERPTVAQLLRHPWMQAAGAC